MRHDYQPYTKERMIELIYTRAISPDKIYPNPGKPEISTLTVDATPLNNATFLFFRHSVQYPLGAYRLPPGDKKEVLYYARGTR